jgi:hypothetical protein
MDLEKLKNTIESWSKHHQVEILKIIKKDQSVTINENKSGIYINMSLIQEDILQEIGGYVAYVEQQETILNSTETQKDELNNNFFV